MIRRLFSRAGKTVIDSPAGTLTVREALRVAMAEEMRRDERVFVIGEEVAQYEGAYKVTKGLLKEFGEKRVVDTPITEMGFTGLAVGASLMGLKPVVEFMTWNFALQGIDHIFNSCAKTRYMSGGDLSGSIVFRGLNGPAASVAAQHSQCFAAALANVPGMLVLSPYDVYDCKALLKAAIRAEEPVCFLENELMYGRSFPVADDFWAEDLVAEVGKLRVMREGKHVTIATFSRMVGEALKAAELLEKEGISCEVLNLRSIRPLDREGLLSSVAKTRRFVAVEDGYPFAGLAAELVTTVVESPVFDALDAPPERVTGWDVPLPYAANLEALCLPQPESIAKAVRKAVQGAKLA